MSEARSEARERLEKFTAKARPHRCEPPWPCICGEQGYLTPQQARILMSTLPSYGLIHETVGPDIMISRREAIRILDHQANFILQAGTVAIPAEHVGVIESALYSYVECDHKAYAALAALSKAAGR